MKIDLINQKLYTDSGIFLKELKCPKKIRNSDLEKLDGKLNCSVCSRQIVDTNSARDYEILEVLKKEPQTCLKIDLNQKNLGFK